MGGVDNLIKIIEGAAVAKRAPWLVAGGVLVGVAASGLGKLAYDFGTVKYAEYKERQATAQLAKEDLRAATAEGAAPSSLPSDGESR